MTPPRTALDTTHILFLADHDLVMALHNMPDHHRTNMQHLSSVSSKISTNDHDTTIQYTDQRQNTHAWLVPASARDITATLTQHVANMNQSLEDAYHTFQDHTPRYKKTWKLNAAVVAGAVFLLVLMFTASLYYWWYYVSATAIIGLAALWVYGRQIAAVNALRQAHDAYQIHYAALRQQISDEAMVQYFSALRHSGAPLIHIANPDVTDQFTAADRDAIYDIANDLPEHNAATRQEVLAEYLQKKQERRTALVHRKTAQYFND